MIARTVESHGIATVCLSINRSVSERVVAPRTAFVRFPHGASFGEPGQVAQQMTILRDLLLLLVTAQKPGTIVDLPYRWKRWQYGPVTPESFVTEAARIPD